MANENTYQNLSETEREAAVIQEFLPFFIYAAIPIMIALTIAWTFGPSI